MKDRITLLLISAPLFFLIGLVVFFSMQSAYLPEVTLRIQGYDPRDLLSGHYISYRIDWANSDCLQFPDKTCPKGNAFFKNQKFYVPEAEAAKLDELLRNPQGRIFEVVYSFGDGVRPRPKRLLINGQDWLIAVKNEG